jgi:hypothetical protein
MQQQLSSELAAKKAAVAGLQRKLAQAEAGLPRIESHHEILQKIEFMQATTIWAHNEHMRQGELRKVSCLRSYPL